MSQQSEPEWASDPRKKIKISTKTNRDITSNKPLDCVVACGGTLKANFSKAFKTVLKPSHSCSHHVKWYIPQFTFAINQLERQNGLWGHQWRLVLRTKKCLVTNPRRDFPNKRWSNCPRSCLWVCPTATEGVYDQIIPHSSWNLVIQSCPTSKKPKFSLNIYCLLNKLEKQQLNLNQARLVFHSNGHFSNWTRDIWPLFLHTKKRKYVCMVPCKW